MDATPLTRRLREQTSDLHRRVERAVDLPLRCRSAAGYRELLLRMLGAPGEGTAFFFTLAVPGEKAP
ncbi:MAG: hypothetical protein ABUT39_29045 [Acidobacteriota bacterium]